MATPQGYNELRESVAQLEWPGLRTFRIQGADAREWLQGQVTNDLRRLGPDTPVTALLVKSTGQILETLSVHEEGTDLLVIVDGGEELLKRVDEFVILEDLTMEEVQGPIRLLVGPSASGVRTGLLGIESSVTFQDSVFPIASLESVSRLTLERGIAVARFDADDKTFPPELGSDFDRQFVAYDKGCYFGQEVLQRIHSRGHTNREWAVYHTDAPVAKRDEVKTGDGARAGIVTRCSESENGYLCGVMTQKKVLVEGAELFVGSLRLSKPAELS